MSDEETDRRPSAAAATLRAAAPQRRGLLQAALAASAALAIGAHAPAARGQARPFAGVTLNGAGFQHVSTQNSKDLLPETAMKEAQQQSIEELAKAGVKL